MFSELLARAKTQHSCKLPFAIYRKPNEETVKAVFQNDGLLNHVGDYSEVGFVFAPFHSNQPPILLRIDEKLEANDFTGKSIVTGNDRLPETQDFQKSIYKKLVEKGIQAIHRGSFKKVVLSRKMEVTSRNSPFDILRSILSTYATAFCYLWYHPKVGLWLGATPEILLHIENNRFTTMSLAGTQSAIQNDHPLWGDKELKEQSLVTSYIQDALAPMVSGLKATEPESVRAGNLWHLRSKITGRQQSSLSQIIKVLHPTPAVCGLPLKETQQFIIDNENYDREFYTGFLGELNMLWKKDRVSNSRNIENKAYGVVKKETELFVNLRCVQIRKDKALVYIGGGITCDSNPDSEWEETVHKSRTMLTVLYQN